MEGARLYSKLGSHERFRPESSINLGKLLWLPCGEWIVCRKVGVEAVSLLEQPPQDMEEVWPGLEDSYFSFFKGLERGEGREKERERERNINM